MKNAAKSKARKKDKASKAPPKKQKESGDHVVEFH